MRWYTLGKYIENAIFTHACIYVEINLNKRLIIKSAIVCLKKIMLVNLNPMMSSYKQEQEHYKQEQEHLNGENEIIYFNFKEHYE